MLGFPRFSIHFWTFRYCEWRIFSCSSYRSLITPRNAASFGFLAKSDNVCLNPCVPAQNWEHADYRSLHLKCSITVVTSSRLVFWFVTLPSISTFLYFRWLCRDYPAFWRRDMKLYFLTQAVIYLLQFPRDVRVFILRAKMCPRKLQEILRLSLPVPNYGKYKRFFVMRMWQLLRQSLLSVLYQQKFGMCDASRSPTIRWIRTAGSWLLFVSPIFRRNLEPGLSPT
jgi:hypothetical protein